jgi:hypothetical protein
VIGDFGIEGLKRVSLVTKQSPNLTSSNLPSIRPRASSCRNRPGRKRGEARALAQSLIQAREQMPARDTLRVGRRNVEFRI